MINKSDSGRQYYISKMMRESLASIVAAPLTIIEAPSGFGKTTAVHQYLKERTKAHCHWYTCLGLPQEAGWRGICELFGKVSVVTGRYLKRISIPTLHTIPYIAEIITNIPCETETYLVIDNFQMTNLEVRNELIHVFSTHGNSNLHIILLTQQIGIKSQIGVSKEHIHLIDSSAFLFDQQSMAKLLAAQRFRITQKELVLLHQITEGWISAILLQCMYYKKYGKFEHHQDISCLVERALWNQLDDQKQAFLLAVSMLDGFTYQQALAILEEEKMPDEIASLLHHSAFIHYDSGKGMFVLHTILNEYLTQYRSHQLDTKAQQKLYKMVGKALAKSGEYFRAMVLYHACGEYELLLSLPITLECLIPIDKSNVRIMESIVWQCDEKCWKKYPDKMLIFAYLLVMHVKKEPFYKLYRILQEIIPSEKPDLEGEFILLSSFTHFNHLSKMAEAWEYASQRMTQPSYILYEKLPITLGSYSMFYFYWRESDQINTFLKIADRSNEIGKLANGQGAGAFSLMKAEVLLMSGKSQEAKILCYQAQYESKFAKETGIAACIQLLLGRIAILQQDEAGFRSAFQMLKDYTTEEQPPEILRLADFCLSALSLVMGTTEYVARWIYSMDTIREVIWEPVVPIAQMLLANCLLIERRYSEFYGLSPAWMSESRRFEYLMPQLFHLLFLTIAKYRTGYTMEAKEYLHQALRLALPDRIYLPFAQQGTLLFPMLQEAKQTDLDKTRIEELIAVCKRQIQGMKAIAHAGKNSKLTPREREVAVFAKDRFSAREIADQLCISEATVRTILKSVYAKLQIHSKAELKDKIF